MKAAERQVVVRVLAKTVRKVSADYEHQCEALKSEVAELRSLIEQQAQMHVSERAPEVSVPSEQLEAAVSAYFEANPPREPEDGKSVTADDVMPDLMGHVQAALDAIPVPQDGSDATDDQIARAVADYLEINPPARGESVTADQVMPQLREELKNAIDSLPSANDVRSAVADQISAAIEAIPAPQNGKDADPEVISKMITDAVAEIPKPQDGKSVTAEDVAPMIVEQVELAVASIPKPKDGDDGTSVTADDVLAVLEPRIVEWELDFERRAQSLFERAVERIPVPKDGQDGFNLEDFEVQYDGERTFTHFYQRGEERKEFEFHIPIPLDRGFYKDGNRYERGDLVTHAGSLWMALQETEARPATASGEWRLVARRGRDGKRPKDE